MILFFRKYLIKVSLLISLAAVILGGYYYFSFLRFHHGPVSFQTGQIWWLVYSDRTVIDPLLPWISLMGSGLYAFLFGYFISRQIRKTPSPQLAFLFLFVFSLSLNLFRLNFQIPDFSFLKIERDFATRIVYFGRFYSLSTFFAASLFATGLQIQKFGVALLITTLASFTISLILPFNSTQLTSAFLYRVGEEKNVALFCLVLELLTLLNYLSAAIKQSRSDFYKLILFSLMMMGGLELLFFLYIPFALPGAFLLISGTILYMRTSQKLFLWS